MDLTDLYFAYGADMDLNHLKRRAGHAIPVGPARLEGYRLAFFGHDPMWDGAMETLVRAPGAVTWGVLYRLDPAAWDRLDTLVGATLEGSGLYFHYPLDVITAEGQGYSVRSYKKDVQGVPRTPSTEYLELFLRGAAAQGLPDTYQEFLRTLPHHRAKKDIPATDPRRRRSLPVLPD
jgi:hypothetical protein